MTDNQNLEFKFNDVQKIIGCSKTWLNDKLRTRRNGTKEKIYSPIKNKKISTGSGNHINYCYQDVVNLYIHYLSSSKKINKEVPKRIVKSIDPLKTDYFETSDKYNAINITINIKKIREIIDLKIKGLFK